MTNLASASAQALVVIQAIDTIIEIIPDDFEFRAQLVKTLEARKEFICNTDDPALLQCFWKGIAKILHYKLPDPQKVLWSGAIAKVFSRV